MNTYYVQASEVAGLIGLNPYQPVEKVLLKFIQRHKHSQVFEILKECNLRKIEDMSKEAIHNNNVLSIWYKKALKCQENEKLQKIFGTIEKVINKDEEIKQKKEIYNEIKSTIQKRRGNIYENKGINKYEQKFKKTITDRNSQIFEKIINGGDFKIIIKAKVDGIDRENNCLIEHKNRVRRLFDEIPGYEKVQLCIYLKLTNMDICKLIQTHFDDTKELEYTNDESFWKQIKVSLKKIIKKAHKILNDPNELKKFIIKNQAYL